MSHALSLVLFHHSVLAPFHHSVHAHVHHSILALLHHSALSPSIPCTLVLFYPCALSPFAPSFSCLISVLCLRASLAHMSGTLAPMFCTLSSEVTNGSGTRFLDSHQVWVSPPLRARVQVKTRFLSQHHFSVQKVQTHSIATCSVQVSPPLSSRTTTPSTFTEWQMAFIGSHHGSNILGQKAPKQTTKVTLTSHQLCNSLHYHQCYRERCVWEWYNVSKKSSTKRDMYCKTASIKEKNSCKYPTKQKRSPVDNNTQWAMPILYCFQLASNQWIDLIRLNHFTLSTSISCVRSWCKWSQW